MFTETVKTLPINLLPIVFFLLDETLQWQTIEKITPEIWVEDVAKRLNDPVRYSPDYLLCGSYKEINGRAYFYIQPKGNWNLYITGVPKEGIDKFKIINAENFFYFEDKDIGYLVQIIFNK